MKLLQELMQLNESVQINTKLEINFNKWTTDDLIQAHKNAGYNYSKKEWDDLFVHWKYCGINERGHPTFVVAWFDEHDQDEDAAFSVSLFLIGFAFGTIGQLSLEIGDILKSKTTQDEAEEYVDNFELRVR